MRKKAIYHYYVEGEDEKRLLDALKSELGCIQSGKVEKFNVIQNRFTKARIRPLKHGTIVVLVYDTDIETNVNILEENVRFLKKQSGIKDVLCVPQTKDLEEELTRACQIRNIWELTKSATKKDYKRDLISCSNLGERLRRCQFDISKLWSEIPSNKFKSFGNDAKKIRIINKK